MTDRQTEARQRIGGLPLRPSPYPQTRTQGLQKNAANGVSLGPACVSEAEERPKGGVPERRGETWGWTLGFWRRVTWAEGCGCWSGPSLNLDYLRVPFLTLAC